MSSAGSAELRVDVAVFRGGETAGFVARPEDRAIRTASGEKQEDKRENKDQRLHEDSSLAGGTGDPPDRPSCFWAAGGLQWECPRGVLVIRHSVG